MRGVRYVYANGVEVIHGPSGGVKFIGADGEIVVNRGKLTASKPELLTDPLPKDAIKLYASPGHQRDWLNCIKSRKLPICDVEIGARSVTVCHLGNIAYWTRKKLRWEPSKWEFIGADAEVAKWLDRDRREGYELPTV
jgi:hypothetical protein